MCKSFSLIAIILLIATQGCNTEPPVNDYSFTIINKSHASIWVEYKTAKYEDFYSDTLRPGKDVITGNTDHGCYEDFGDTLIKHFFTELKIRVRNKMIKTDLFKRNNWVEVKDLKGFLCRGGFLYYTIEIKDTDLE